MAIPYPAILILSLVATVGVHLWGLDGIYALPWLMFFTATVASVRGIGTGLLAAFGSMVALYFFSSSPLDYWVMGLILVLSAYLADQVGASLRRAHRRAKQLAQIQDVFLQGLEVVPNFFNRQQLLRELPNLLSRLLRNSKLHIWVPLPHEQLRLLDGPATNLPSPLVQRALQERRLIGSPPPASVSLLYERGLHEVAMPLSLRNEPVAVLQFVRDEPWQKEELELFARLAQTISRQLEHLHNLELRRLLLAVADGVAAASDKSKVAEVALNHLLPALEMEAGAVMQYRKGLLQGIAWSLPADMQTTLTPLAQQLTYHQGLAWRAYHSGVPQYSDSYSSLPEALPELKALGFESLVAYPVHTRDAMKGRVVLVLGSRAKIAWTASKREILLGVEKLLSSALERVLLEELHQRINRLLTEAWSYPSEEVYLHILEAAVELVPGSEAGSLWVQEGAAYVCRAAIGATWNCDKQQSDSLQEWYARNPSQVSQETPRIQVEGARANLCLPVSHQGRVLAYLNLANLQDPEAFAEDSLTAAQLFATPIATLVHELQNRASLEKAALTDGLTGLYNRRAFDRRLAEEVERARRYEYPLSLLVLDLKNFKPINDRFGHAVGDQALVMVAQTLKQTHRAGDMIFRWGGDEFAVLLPQTNAEGARAAAEHLLQAVSRVCFEGICLTANIGRATFPDEAAGPEELLRLADGRMYQHKQESTSPSDR